MTEQLKPSEIRDLITQGKISPEQGMQMFQQSHKDNPKTLTKIHPQNLYARDQQHYITRMNLEENLRHISATPIYGAVGIADGILDGLIFGATELAEDISFGITRIIYRFRDGGERGKQ